MNKELLNKCYEKFELRERRGQGNQNFKYVSSRDVIHRMNTIFAGNWNTEVMSTDILEDQVILRVQVCVTDPETNIDYCHAGFGSHQIMKYSGGPNVGKIIDIGNAYKGALSKAIVNACKMWGVGLFKEADVDFDVDDDGDFVVPPITAPPPVMQSPPVAIAAPKPVAVVVAVPPAPVAVAPTKPALPSAADMPSRPSLAIPSRPVIPAAPAAPTTVPASAPIVPTAPSDTPVPAADLPFSTTQPETVSKINDVQKVAISGILTLRKMTYDQLASEAFADAGAPGYQYPLVEQLTYDEAVVVIKYGNNKFRKH